MAFPTKRGDDGTTDIFIKGKLSRISKSNMIIEVLGDIDELNSFIGVAKNYSKSELELEKVQNDLITISAMIANRDSEKQISEEELEFLENEIENLKEGSNEFTDFVIPGGSKASSYLDVCRTVCRRVERSVVKLNEKVKTDPIIMKYTNRLSTLLFLMARTEEKE